RANIPRGRPPEMNPLPARLDPSASVRPSRHPHRSASGAMRTPGPNLVAAGLVACAVLALSLACPRAHADTAEGYDAGRRGDYVTALREFQPAAEKGDRD